MHELHNKSFDLVAFGFVCPLIIAKVKDYPEANQGTVITNIFDSICADAPIVTLVAANFGKRVGYIGNKLGKDEKGKKVFRLFSKHNIDTTVTLSPHIQTPLTFTVSDDQDNRTWFSYLPDVFEGLINAKLDFIRCAKLLYVDTYKLYREASLNAIRYANDHNTPLFINLGGDPFDKHLKDALKNGAAILQTNSNNLSLKDCHIYAKSLLENGVQFSVVTMGENGVVYADDTGSYHLPALDVKIIHTAGAGAVFSAGVILGFLEEWHFSKTIKFATNLAGVYCSRSESINEFAQSLSINLESLLPEEGVGLT